MQQPGANNFLLWDFVSLFDRRDPFCQKRKLAPFGSWWHSFLMRGASVKNRISQWALLDLFFRDDSLDHTCAWMPAWSTTLFLLCSLLTFAVPALQGLLMGKKMVLGSRKGT